LEFLIHNYEHLRDHSISAATKINLVMNTDRLSFSEAFRIKKKLKDIGITIDSVIINKAQSNEVPDKVQDEFNNQKIALFPLSSKSLLGYKAINEYIDENNEIFLEIK